MMESSYCNFKNIFMDGKLKNHIANLKSALMSLSPTGENGFEGLISIILNEITGVSFRLAGSGSQFGLDGKSSHESDSICFEAKRYDKSPSREGILAKITELSINDHGVDIWVLASSAALKTQIVDDARKVGSKDDIYILVLDWAENYISPLAIALAMGGERAVDFIKANSNGSPLSFELQTSLHAIQTHKQFSIESEKLKQSCNSASIGFALANKSNTEWLLDKLSNKQKAKQQFGQPICPKDPTILNIKERMNLIDRFKPFFTNVSDSLVIIANGGEGNGKSWIIAQSWLALTHKPIMVFMNPEDFPSSAQAANITDILIDKLIQQTGEDNSQPMHTRWRRKLTQWKNQLGKKKLHLIVVIDGINQKPNTDWARIIDVTNTEVNELGGRLVVSSRTPYFNNQVKDRIESKYEEIVIPEWTEKERNEILLEKKINGSELRPNVAKSLCNPRLLGITIELLSKEDITSIDELNVSRLLFEHMRTMEKDANEPQPVAEFAKRLKNDAQVIQSRIIQGQEDDLKVFENELALVTDGRFYEPLGDDPTRYLIKDEGLTLALGFSIIDKLNTAFRNNRDLEDTLNRILAPITALDDTAEVILAALTVVILDDTSNENVIVTLIRGFSHLQNTNSDDFPIFTGLTKKKPSEFLITARELSLLGGHQANFDWIEGALLLSRNDEKLWHKIETEVLSWLSLYSLSPKVRAFKNTEEELQKISNKITASIDNLSTVEKKLLKNMKEVTDGDLGRLATLALALLTGKPLAKYSKELCQWKFTQALNSSHYSPRQDFIDLIRLNTIDWSATRNELLNYADKLRDKNVSTVGKWTLTSILRSTGHAADGSECELLVKELTKERGQFGGWRRIEDYCSVDPCDPSTVKPSNITQTKEIYQDIDVKKLMLRMGNTSEGICLRSAGIGMARFAPDTSINKHRDLIDNVVTRTDIELQQGLYGLEPHSSLITTAHAHKYLSKWKNIKCGIEPLNITDSNKKYTPQHILVLIFPLLNADEQASIFLSDEMEESILYDLLELLKPLDEIQLVEYFEIAAKENNNHKFLLTLYFSHYTLNTMPASIRDYIAKGLSSKSQRIREESLGVVVETKDRELLNKIAKSNFNATKINNDNIYEIWYGSLAILQAAKNNLITDEEALNRISPKVFGRAYAILLDLSTKKKIIALIDKSLSFVANLNNEPNQIDIELQVDAQEPNEPNLVLIDEAIIKKKTSIWNDSFEKRRKFVDDSFDEFQSALTKQKASIVLDDLSHFELEAIIHADQEFSEKWYKIFLNTNEHQIPARYNFILKFAYAFRINAPEKSAQLLNKIMNSKPWVNLVSGRAKVGLDAIVTWSCDHEIIKKLQFQHLNSAKTDKELAIEVVAALLNDKHDILNSYITEKLVQVEPSEVARGVMVAGFSDVSEFNDNILKKYSNSNGLIGAAYKAAKYAYERNKWSRHWYELMNTTNKLEEFWCYSQLFLKIIDHRYDIWEKEYSSNSHPVNQYAHTYQDKIRHRFEQWEKHREKTLFGEKAPKPVFLNII